MITILNHLRNRPQYPTRDIRHALNNLNEEIIKEVERHLQVLNPDLYTGTVTVSNDKDEIYKVEIERSDAETAKRITTLLQPYLDSLNNWSDQ